MADKLITNQLPTEGYYWIFYIDRYGNENIELVEIRNGLVNYMGTEMSDSWDTFSSGIKSYSFLPINTPNWKDGGMA